MTTLADQFEVDCAVMSGADYVSNRNPVNQLPVPPGWTLGKYTSLPSGFEGASFTNGTQIVISYTGTNPATVNDLVADLALGTGFGSTQLDQAVDFYLQTVAANPGVPITFTGHSLGGGLAALMAVFFNQTAVTFDQAPFAASATASVAQDLLAYLKGENKYSDAQLKNLSDFIDAANNAPGTIPNAANVTDTNVQGEILSYVSALRIGAQPQTYIQQQNDMPISMLNLHSQALLTAFLQSQASWEITQSGAQHA